MIGRSVLFCSRAFTRDSVVRRHFVRRLAWHRAVRAYTKPHG